MSPTALAEQRKFVRSWPEEAGLRRLAEAVGMGEVRVATRLVGGAITSTHLVEAERGPHRWLVLKRFTNGDAELASTEWRLLSAAADVPLPTPRPVALDESGLWFGCPAVVTAALPGQVVLRPDDSHRWLSELATGLAAVHSTRWIDDPLLHRAAPWQTWQPWSEADRAITALLNETIEDLRRIAPTEEAVFSHGDYHPANVLFDDGALSGVIDWSAAKLQPRGADLAQCRCELAIWPGGDAPATFLNAYEQAASFTSETQPWWDVLAAARVLQWHALWLPIYAELGVEMTAENLVRRVRAFLADALERIRSDRGRTS